MQSAIAEQTDLGLLGAITEYVAAISADAWVPARGCGRSPKGDFRALSATSTAYPNLGAGERIARFVAFLICAAVLAIRKPEPVVR